MADNFTANPGAGGDTFSADDVAGVKVPYSKLDIGADGASSPVNAGNPLPVSGDFYQVTQPVSIAAPLVIESVPVAYTPGYGSPATSVSNGLPIDPSGQVSIRGSVMTDEGTFRCNFANTSLSVALGTVTIVDDVVTGAGFNSVDVHYYDYFKLDADGESAWVQIDSIDSDTQLTLVSAYVGGASGAASRALMKPSTGSGGSIAVASGVCTITTGTTNNAVTRISRNVDVPPMIFRGRVGLNQRIANQTFRVGLSEPDTVTDRWFARFKIDGVTSTTVICESGHNPTTTPSASETETTTITLPNGITTASNPEYRVEILTEKAVFSVNGVIVAEHSRVIPAQHDEMEAAVCCINGTGAASSTTVSIDYVTGKNHNKLEIGVMSDSEKIVAAQGPLVTSNYSQAGVIAINTDLLIIDCNQIRSLSIQCSSMGTTGVITPAFSNDGATYVNTNITTSSGASAATFNAAGLWTAPCVGRYFRLRLTTATTAGTTTLIVNGYQVQIGPVSAQPINGGVSVTGYPTAAASADALANPTVTKIDVTNLLFNGTSWDRQRGMSTALTTGDTGAKTVTGNGATITNVGNKGVQILINMGVVSGTTPTFVGKIQGSTDAGTLWYDVPGAVTASLTATGQYGIMIYPGIATTAGVATTGTTATCSMVLPRTWRLVWTIGGTTPSFTITAVQYIYIPN